jgi:SAM-dependent methyltransferase
VQDRVANIVEGTIVDLSRFPDETFDAVICLGGPLSHILDAGNRERAIAELIRVTRPGAPIFASVMGRLSLLVLEMVMFQAEIGMPHFTQIRDTGEYEGGHGFTACHFFLPEELRAAFTGRGATVVEMAGLEGISSHHPQRLNRLAKDETLWPIWLETHYRTCTHPAVVGLSEHMLIVCRRPADGA